MGQAYVERDGVSVRHASRFLLVGTMNPEEGELRPQLLDRFGLTVDVAAPREPAPRAEVVRRRLAYERDPGGFAVTWAGEDTGLAAAIAAARHRLPHVTLPEAELTRIATVCAAFEVDGLRADIVVARTAVAHAAWQGRPLVTEQDVRVAARLALPHRRRRDPFDAPGLDQDQLDRVLDEARTDEPEPDPDGPPDPPPGDPPPHDQPPQDPTPQDPAPPSGSQPHTSASDPPYRARLLTVPGTGTGARAGRRSLAYTRSGRIVAARTPRGRVGTVHLVATLTAAAAAGRRTVTPADLRESVHKGRESNLVLFVVDASGSMAARQRMRAVKGAVLSLLRDAYQRRDKVGLITFRGQGADLVLPPTTSHEIAAARLREVRTGGRTPLAAALTAAARAVRTHKLRDPHRRALVVLVTDGRHTTGPEPAGIAPLLRGTAAVVVDCESGPVRLGLAQRLAVALDAEYLKVDQLSTEALRAAATPIARRAA
jgi:magnesium chelatase subunit D